MTQLSRSLKTLCLILLRHTKYLKELKSFVDKILSSNVSYQNDTWSNLSKQITIETALGNIKGDLYKKQVEHLRDLLKHGQNDSYKVEKLKLPAVTFCGVFTDSRRKENLKEYNELIVIDIDKLTIDQLKIVKEQLQNDDYVFSFWLSPSSNGFKGLIPLKSNFEIPDINIFHKCAFEKLSEYFWVTYNISLDLSGSDTTRLCFMSHDPNICIKDSVTLFEIQELDLKNIVRFEEKETKKTKLHNTTQKNALYNPKGKNNNLDKRSIKDIIAYLTKRQIVITGEYEQRYRIAYSIANSFTYDIGLKFFIELCKIEKEKFNERRETSLLLYCYENNSGRITFKYIEDLVKKYGYVKKTLEKVVS